RSDIVVLGTDGWAWDAIASVPPEMRPAVVAVGAAAAAHASSADEWILESTDIGEARRRIHVALERARTRRRVARRAFVDSLTGLPNRRAALRALMREAGRARRNEGALSLVLLDLDDFKAVNERGGHAAGDRVLRGVGQVLRAATRSDE